jgi:hypothetical protein
MTSKFTRAAKGQECQVRIPGICNRDDTTTVFAHLSGGGMGGKVRDIHGAFCCSACHDAVDGRSTKGVCTHTRTDIILMHLEGMVRTQNLLIDMGILLL